MESAKALTRIGEIASCSPRQTALIFGADDYAASMGAVRTKNSSEVWFARNQVAVYAVANGLQVIDLVQIDFNGTIICNVCLIDAA